MADYNLSGLATRSFEQLIQALASKLIGPNVVIFGDGPDGAREATFDGRIPFPSVADQWEGYGIIQAKFLQRPQNSTRDGHWAIYQLTQELKKFSDRKRKLKRPEYYIFATNVVLSPVAGRGFKDRVISIMQSYQARNGLKGFAIWDFDQIRVFLDNNREVATSYSAWITPGDVLAEVIKLLGIQQPKFDQIIANFLQKELMSDQNANLQQAGHVTKDSVPLSSVFTDLLASERRLYEPEEEKAPLAPGFIDEILSASHAKCDPDSLASVAGSSSQSATGAIQRTGKYVLIGGPGQGKTTLGQYLCQLFRVALLQDRPRLSADAKRAMEQIRKESLGDKLPLPSARRFPIRVVLSEFAKALAVQSSGVTSLLNYISTRISQRTNYNVDVAAFRQWMAAYPWLLILDGLDEVPSSSNRDQVMSAIHDFWVDAAELNADILTIATTRPQGYSNEFSPEFYLHKHLAPLSEFRALRYAQKLTRVRYSADTDRQTKVYTRLQRAASEPSTTRLMRSPLQVTIMAELLDKLGQAPQERWSLFKEYFKIIYDREVERDIPTSGILRQYRSDIDLIHYKTGLLLQLESEKSGQTDAKLRTSRFGTLVHTHFSNEGHSGTDLENLTSKIMTAASQRLVFLVGVEAGQVGFEIRSLQEFMAAEGLMQGGDTCIMERLRSIAPLVYWRPVFLFAPGKCYVDRKHLRDTICSICAELNEDKTDEGLRVIHAGSQLALDLLEDGTARTQPKHYQALARLACRLFDSPPDEIHVRIASMHGPELDDVFREEIKRQLANINPMDRASAWIGTVQLASLGVGWATELLEGAGEEDFGPILEACAIARYSDRLNPILRNAISHVPPTNRARKIAIQKLYGIGALGRAPWADVINDITNSSQTEDKKGRLAHLLLGDGTKVLSVGFAPLRPNWMHGLQALPNPAAKWSPYQKTAEFVTNPSPATLAEALNKFSEQPGELPNAIGLPWPVLLCLQACETKEELPGLAQRVADGSLGTKNDWLAAEERWRAGVSLQEMFRNPKGSLPFDSSIALRGFPTAVVTVLLLNPIQPKNFDELVPQVRSIPDKTGRGEAACWLLRIFRTYASTFPSKGLEELLLLAVDSTWGIDLSILNRFSSLDESIIDSLNQVGQTARLFLLTEPLAFDRVNQIAQIYSRYPARTGLLRVIASALPDVPISELVPPTRGVIQDLDRDFQSAALSVRFATGVFQPEDVDLITSMILDPALSKRQQVSYLDSLIEALLKTSETEKADRAIARLMELLKEVPGSAPKLMRALNATIRRRRSNICDPAIWAKLELSSISLEVTG